MLQKGPVTIGDTSEELSDDDILETGGEWTMKPRRRWMSVSDLVTKVEVAMLVGEQLQKGDTTYTNLVTESDRLRLANDGLIARIGTLKDERAKLVATESEVSARMQTETDYHKMREAKMELVTVLEAIETVDRNLAGVRYEHQRNIADMGMLKRTMSNIEKEGAVSELVTLASQKLKYGSLDPVILNPPDMKVLVSLLDRLRAESDGLFDRIAAFTTELEQLRSDLRTSQLDLRAVRDLLPGREADEIRLKVVAQLKESKRKMAQLMRLRDIQVINADEIARLERLRSKIAAKAEIDKLVQEGDVADITAKLGELTADLSNLQEKIKDMEVETVDTDSDAAHIMAKLRHVTRKDLWNVETSELREQLIGIHHGEQLRLGRLATLRNQKAESLRFAAVLKTALRARD